MPLITRVNYARNPSFNYGADFWIGNGGATIAATVFGGQVTWPTAASGAASVTQTVIGLTIGNTYTVTISSLNVTSGPACSVYVVGFTPGSSATVFSPLFRNSTKVTFVATATQHDVGVISAGATTAGQSVTFGAVLVSDGSSNLEFFDGDLPGAVWAAAPGRSSSSMAWDTTSTNAIPRTIVEFDARPTGPGDFVLDSSKLDGNDVLVSTPRWMPVTEWTAVSIRRGRQRPDSPMQPGTAEVTVLDYAGKYDPDNPSTPLITNGQPIMRSTMRGRIGVVLSIIGELVYYPLFVGGLEDVAIQRAYDPVTTVTFVDDLAAVNLVELPPMTPPYGQGLNSLTHINKLLSFVGMSSADIVNPGLGRRLLANPGGGSIGAGLTNIANAEGGIFFARSDGQLQVTKHADDFGRVISAVFTDSPSNTTDLEFDTISTSTSLKSLINFATVDRGTDGVPNMYGHDDASIALNGKMSETITAPLFSDSEAQSLANWRANRRSKAATSVDGITSTLTGQPARWANVAQWLDMGAHVRIKRQAFGRLIDQIFVVEGVDHDINAEGWHMALYTSPVDFAELYGDAHPFRLDTSLLDGPDVMTAY